LDFSNLRCGNCVPVITESSQHYYACADGYFAIFSGVYHIVIVDFFAAAEGSFVSHTRTQFSCAVIATSVWVGCLEEPQTLEQYACEGTKLYISCGAASEIHVVDANYGRTENSMCGSSNDNCHFNATCIVKKWFAFE